MQKALKDKTNKKVDSSIKKHPEMGEKEGVVTYLRQVSCRTKDGNLKYDIIKCIELLEGKENQETLDLKEALEEVLLEKEMLFREKCELAAEIDLLKSHQDESDVLPS